MLVQKVARFKIHYDQTADGFSLADKWDAQYPQVGVSKSLGLQGCGELSDDLFAGIFIPLVITAIEPNWS